MGDGQHIWAAAEWVLMMRGMFLRPESAKDGNVFVEQFAAFVKVRVEIAVFGFVPANADPDNDLASREMFEGRDLFGGDDGVAHREDKDAQTQSDVRREGCEICECGDGFGAVAILGMLDGHEDVVGCPNGIKTE